MSEVKTAKLSPRTGSGTVTLGTSGDTFDVPSGVTLDVTGATVTGLSAGKVLQVVQAVKTDTATTVSGTLASTGLEVTITPSATSSKVLIMISAIAGSHSDVAPYFQVNRDATVLTGILGDAAGSRELNASATAQQYMNYDVKSIPVIYLDSPSSTSALTYKLMWALGVPASGFLAYLNRTFSDYDSATYSRSASSITVMEIEG